MEPGGFSAFPVAFLRKPLAGVIPHFATLLVKCLRFDVHHAASTFLFSLGPGGVLGSVPCYIFAHARAWQLAKFLPSKAKDGTGTRNTFF